MPRRGVRFALEGDKELMRKLRRLPGNVGRRVLMDACRAAAAPIEDAIRSRAPVGPTGNLKRAVATRVKLHRNEFVVLHVGSFAPHAHLVEYGHDVKRTKGGPVVGRARKHPFARPAFDERKQQAAVKALQLLRAGVEREAVRG